jgi:hypothetical protein
MLFYLYEAFDDITVSTFWKHKGMIVGLADRTYVLY